MVIRPGYTSYDQKTNKEKKHCKTIYNFYRVRFPQQLGLDAILASWDLKIQIPRRKLRI